MVQLEAVTQIQLVVKAVVIENVNQVVECMLRLIKRMGLQPSIIPED